MQCRVIGCLSDQADVLTRRLCRWHEQEYQALRRRVIERSAQPRAEHDVDAAAWTAFTREHISLRP